jgi:hypothetical protein
VKDSYYNVVGGETDDQWRVQVEGSDAGKFTHQRSGHPRSFPRLGAHGVCLEEDHEDKKT